MKGKTRRIKSADLFAGGGGTSTGLAKACRDLGVKVNLVAINHWKQALNTHQRNHPWARHICASAETVDPRDAVPGGHLDIMVASPECTFHSLARGGRPILDQKRASGWVILRWLELLEVDSLLVENVSEYQNWGPIGKNGRPIKSRKGETYNAWFNAIKSLGYNAEGRVLNAADYGAATSRRRLFVMAKRGNKPLHWPKPTFSKEAKVPGTKRWRAAREIIDWSLRGRSIFSRKKPLAPATMRRIIKGLERFGGPELQPFLVILRGTGTVKSVEDPIPTLTAGGNHVGLADPSFVMATGGRPGRMEPRSPDEPLPTVIPNDRMSLFQAFILPPEGIYRGNAPRSPEDPLQTITRRGGGHLVQPFVLSMASGGAPRSTEDPTPTFVGKGGGLLVQPFIVPQFGEAPGQEPRVHSVENPLPAPTSHGAGALVEPYFVQYNGCSEVHSVEGPVPALTTKDRLGLVQPELGERALTDDRYRMGMPVYNGRVLDIRFRMLQPHELACAMGFDRSYQFLGTKGAIVRMIGNAVEVKVAYALCKALLTTKPAKVLDSYGG